MVIKISDYLKSKQRTYDGTMTHSSLCDKIKEMVHKVNTTNDTDEDITNFILDSFLDHDIVSIYNELGRVEWVRFMTTIINHEISERNKVIEQESKKSKKWWW